MHEKESVCGVTCACKTNPWFLAISSSDQALHEGLMCPPIDCPDLMLEDDGDATPKLNKPCCSNGDCNDPKCLKAKLKLLRTCKTEFAQSSVKVRYRKYSHTRVLRKQDS